MKKINLFVIMLVIAVLTPMSASSQPNSIFSTKRDINQITPSISVEKRETCATTFYNQIQDVYENCIYYHNYTSCLNSSGPNTACSSKQGTWNFRCKTGEVVITKNNTDCKPNNQFFIEITKGQTIVKKEIDFSQWGACIYNEENNCLIVTCQSIYDGANDGKFHGCKGGTSCQKFEICDDNVRAFYKNSREDFVEQDPTFYLEKLAVKEVGK